MMHYIQICIFLTYQQIQWVLKVPFPRVEATRAPSNLVFEIFREHFARGRVARA